MRTQSTPKASVCTSSEANVHADAPKVGRILSKRRRPFLLRNKNFQLFSARIRFFGEKSLDCAPFFVFTEI